ncbi:MAG: hypothetical protein ACREWE_00060 [Gammaproteobacteria bacterium]
MQTFTLEEAAGLIANKYGWHEGARQTLQAQLLDAAKDGTLTVRHPHTDLPYRPKQYRWFYERVSASDLNRYFEDVGVPWRLWPDPLDQLEGRGSAREQPAGIPEEPDIRPVRVGDNIFQDMDGLTWPEITMTFIEAESVRVRARGRNETFTFDAMGFRHRTSQMAKPNECWKTFLHLAIVSTTSRSWNDVADNQDLKKRISRLRDELQRFFGIADNPIVFRKGIGYQAAFNLTAEEQAVRNTRERYTDLADEDEGDDIQQVMSEAPWC